MKTRNNQILRLVLAGGAAAALVAAPAQADVMTKYAEVDTVQYQIDLDAEQAEIDREQAKLDREQAALDRQIERWRSELADAGWRFRMLDANNDAVVTETEAVAMPLASRVFDDLDEDGNGKLTATEFQDIAVYASGAPFTRQ